MLTYSVLLLTVGLAMAIAEGCHGDNLLRAMERHNASAYCSSLLYSISATTTIQLPEGVPTGSGPGPVSSACSCLLGVNTTSRGNCDSKTTKDFTSLPSTEVLATDTSATAVSDTFGIPTATLSDIPGGYSFSFSFPATSGSSIPPTCGLSGMTTTVQVTETSISTLYITNLPVSTAVEEDSGGRPGPPGTTTPTTAKTTEASSSVSNDAESSDGTSPTDMSSGSMPWWVPTTTANGSSMGTSETTVDATAGISTSSNVTSEVISITSRPGATITLVINGNITTITGELPDDQTKPTSSSASQSDDSQWTLTWISGSTETMPTPSPAPILTTITSDMGNGITSTWIVTADSPIASALETSSASSASSSRTSSGDSSGSSPISGDVSTSTAISASTVVEATDSSITTSSVIPSETVSLTISVITGVVDGVVSTWTLSGGSTLIASPASTTSAPSPVTSQTPSNGFTVITSAVGGVSGASTLTGSSSITAAPSSVPVGAVITSVVNGTVSTWTVSGGSSQAISNRSTPIFTSTAAGVVTITSLIDGVALTWTVSRGTTLQGSSDSSVTTTARVSVITSVINGELSTLTMIDGSTIVSSSTATPIPTPSSGIVVFTTVINGATSVWTISDGLTLTGAPSPTPNPTINFTIITGMISGSASTWMISGGMTLPVPSVSTTATPTQTNQVIVITSVINGEASTWTVSNGSTLDGSLSTKTSNQSDGFTTKTDTGDGNGASTQTQTAGATSGGSINNTATISTSTSASATSTVYASAFTDISVIAAQNASTCLTLQTPTESLHESLLEHENSPPYIDAFFMNKTGDFVKYLRLRDNASNPVLIDVSDPLRLSIIDKDGDILSIDDQGLHFTSANCSPKIDIIIPGFFDQLSSLTNSTCSNQSNVSVTGAWDMMAPGSLRKRLNDTFEVVLRLRDQCGNAVRSDLPVSVALGGTQCLATPGEGGEFIVNCVFPSSKGPTMECETSVQQTLDRLTNGSFSGTCPSFVSVWSVLLRELTNVVNLDQLLKPLVESGLDTDTDPGRDMLSAIGRFLNLYDFSTSTFKNSSSEGGSKFGGMVESYGVVNITTDVCRSLTTSKTLNLTFTAGDMTLPSVLTVLSSIPSSTQRYEHNVTDPAGLACCPNPGKCVIEGARRYYPPEASIQGSDCLCGTASDGRGIAFRTGRCLGYNQCNASSPCASGAVCLVSNCCGFSVCVNGTECSAPKLGKRWISLFDHEASEGPL
ncbi:uncharacterized protein CTRU02_208992 [Colletotrichum truncatum]|uniref:Uncharacterized protein n=1 Tax=Colletotrichum truncatum TaxID=5467 RepID=A0ACC3YY09_COLTU